MHIASVATSGKPAALFPFDGKKVEQAGLPSSPERIFGRSLENVRLRLHLIFLAIDAICIGSGLLFAGAIRLGSPLHEQGLRTLAVILPAFVAIAVNNRTYSVDSLRRPSVGAMRAIAALLYASAIGLGALFFLKVSADFSRIIFGAGTVFAVIMVGGARILFGGYVGRRHHWTFANRLVIVDDFPVVPRPGDTIVLADSLGILPGEDDPILLDRLSQILDQCDSVVVACPPDRRIKWSHSLKGAALDVEIIMPELGPLGAFEIRSLHDDRTVVVSSRPLSVADRALKRSLDLIFSVALLLFLAPLLMFIAVAIKIDSAGPILFTQPRVGENNRIFRMLKFRSMSVEHTDLTGSRSTSICDERITRLGSFLRRTSLDELPQLFNVLIGEMSIVGPRPHALGSTAEDELFWEIERRYFHRHAMRPGITGLAQVRGLRGATTHRQDLSNRLDADLEYLSDWSIWRDIRIIVATLPVLVHRNAF